MVYVKILINDFRDFYQEKIDEKCEFENCVYEDNVPDSFVQLMKVLFVSVKNDFGSKTSIKFRLVKNREELDQLEKYRLSYINVLPSHDMDCRTGVGRRLVGADTVQHDLFLGRGCWSKNVISHELMHVLGVYHGFGGQKTATQNNLKNSDLFNNYSVKSLQPSDVAKIEELYPKSTPDPCKNVFEGECLKNESSWLTVLRKDLLRIDSSQITYFVTIFAITAVVLLTVICILKYGGRTRCNDKDAILLYSVSEAVTPSANGKTNLCRTYSQYDNVVMPPYLRSDSSS